MPQWCSQHWVVANSLQNPSISDSYCGAQPTASWCPFFSSPDHLFPKAMIKSRLFCTSLEQGVLQKSKGRISMSTESFHSEAAATSIDFCSGSFQCSVIGTHLPESHLVVNYTHLPLVNHFVIAPTTDFQNSHIAQREFESQHWVVVRQQTLIGEPVSIIYLSTTWS